MAEHPRFLGAVPSLAVSDERRAVAFLQDALGFVELRHEGRGLGILRRDQVEIHLWVADGSARARSDTWPAPSPAGSRSPASTSCTSTARPLASSTRMPR